MKKTTLSTYLRLFVTALCLPTAATLAADPTISWIRQLGNDEYDTGYDVAVDGFGHVYVAGETSGSLANVNGGAILAKYDAVGTRLWARQWETGAAYGVSVDGLGSVYVAGVADFGESSRRDSDVFVAKYDAEGGLVWSDQVDAPAHEEVRGISADALGNVYIAGRTDDTLGGTSDDDWDGFLSKYDETGKLHWTRHIRSDDADFADRVAVDGLGNVYTAGFTGGALAGTNAGYTDGFLSKYDEAGTLLWIEQFGTDGSERVYGVATDDMGNAYVAGSTSGSLGGPNPEPGFDDPFVAKYDTSGTLLWIEQWGTSEFDRANDVSTDELGNVYVAGKTDGSDCDPQDLFCSDAFVSKLDSSGKLLWHLRWDHDAANERARGVSSDGQGNVYVTGSTSLDSPSASDVFLLKLTEHLGPTGDFDGDGELKAADIDLLSSAVHGGPYDQGFDLNADTVLDQEDRRIWVEDIYGTLFGDADLNKAVAFEDFLALSVAFGSAGGWASGDFDGNGDVHFPDFLQLSANFGSSAESVQVPEPLSLSPVIIVGLLLFHRLANRVPPRTTMFRARPLGADSNGER